MPRARRQTSTRASDSDGVGVEAGAAERRAERGRVDGDDRPQARAGIVAVDHLLEPLGRHHVEHAGHAPEGTAADRRGLPAVARTVHRAADTRLPWPRTARLPSIRAVPDRCLLDPSPGPPRQPPGLARPPRHRHRRGRRQHHRHRGLRRTWAGARRGPRRQLPRRGAHRRGAGRGRGHRRRARCSSCSTARSSCTTAARSRSWPACRSPTATTCRWPTRRAWPGCATPSPPSPTASTT